MYVDKDVGQVDNDLVVGGSRRNHRLRPAKLQG